MSLNPNHNLKHHDAFSLLEMIVTLVLVAIITVMVLGILQSLQNRMQIINDQLTQYSILQQSFDRLLQDIVTASDRQPNITVRQNAGGTLDTCHLTIATTTDEQQTKSLTQVEWLAVPRDEQQDLVLFRRETKSTDEQPATYVPLCENLYSFQVKLQDPNGETVGDAEGDYGLMAVTAQLFRGASRDPEDITTVSRTFCMKRFQYEAPENLTGQTTQDPNQPANEPNTPVKRRRR